LKALVECALGLALVDLDEEEVLELDEGTVSRPEVATSLPRVVAADRVGARVMAVVDRRPPLVVSDDSGATWREAGGGLPAGRAVAISPEHPDDVLFASASRLYVSRDGGRFWHALALELPEIRAVAWDVG
jgi:photosystem II stability/assembly factor-like uncharacterized protein